MMSMDHLSGKLLFDTPLQDSITKFHQKQF